jgi:hypothetical protein
VVCGRKRTIRLPMTGSVDGAGCDDDADAAAVSLYGVYAMMRELAVNEPHQVWEKDSSLQRGSTDGNELSVSVDGGERYYSRLRFGRLPRR